MVKILAVVALCGAAFLAGQRLPPAPEAAPFDKTDCDFLIDAALTDICAACMCREFSGWWCDHE